MLLSDLHETRHGKGQNRLIRRIKAEVPDIILMAGDMLDEYRSFASAAELLRGLADIPMFFVCGNHEYRVRNIGYHLAAMKKLGVNIMNDRHETIEIKGQALLIAGADDPGRTRIQPGYIGAAAMKKSFSHLKDDGGLKILLAHRPELIGRYAQYPFDLVVSGHAHGGQIRIPFLNIGLYSHGEIFPKYSSGVHRIGKCRMAVSRGLSVFPLLPRIFNPPEIVSITLC
ncbi:MAG: metallophosphoesterase family protein [Oscillospiraceae bacterium]|nr:metallophosphoesterase family protein [Oscillospiraceae bacterium]